MFTLEICHLTLSEDPESRVPLDPVANPEFIIVPCEIVFNAKDAVLAPYKESIEAVPNEFIAWADVNDPEATLATNKV